MSTDFDLMRQGIAAASRQAFDAVRAAHPDERFYAFALYTVDDAVGVIPSMNSEQAYQRAVATEKVRKQGGETLGSDSLSAASLLGDYRWSPYEWTYEGYGSDPFRALSKLFDYRGMADYDEEDPLGFEKFRAGVFASMVLALRDLVEQGVFLDGSNQDTVTVFCSVPHSDCSVWFEHDSARRLNSPRLFHTFERERIKYIADGSEDDDAATSNIRRIYLSILENA